MDLTKVLHEQDIVLRGTEHRDCVDPKFDWYDWVAVSRVLAGEKPGRTLSHAEKLAAVRVELGRGGSENSCVEELHFDRRTVKKLVKELKTGTCMYEQRTCADDNCDVTYRVVDQRRPYCSDACRSRAYQRHYSAVSTTTAAAA